MRNFEVLSDYFLGHDPQLKETLAANSLRLIGIDGNFFVQRDELVTRLQELKEYLDDKDAELASGLQNVINDLSSETGARINADNALSTRINNEVTARQNADSTLQTKINNEKTARQNADGTLQTNINNVSGRVTTLENWKNNNNFVMLEDLTAALSLYYTKTQVDNLIAAIPTLTYEVVQTLPTSNISSRTIYMVHPQDAVEPDYYNEYLYMGDTSQTYDPDKWELIGNTRVDLTNYYTKTEADTKFTYTAGDNVDITNNVISVYGDIIQELKADSIRIWDLQPGIYHIKPNTATELELYYSGSSGSPKAYSAEGILYVYASSTKKMWHLWSCRNGSVNYLRGKTDSSSGSYVTDITTDNVKNDLTETSSGYVLDARQGKALDDAKENVSNKVTSISSSSTDTQYPSAKAVYDLVGNIESILEELDIGGGVS